MDGIVVVFEVTVYDSETRCPVECLCVVCYTVVTRFKERNGKNEAR